MKSRSLHVLAIKWFSLSIIVGIMVGLSTTAFIKILDLSINANQTGYLFLLPLGLFLNALVIYYLFPKADAHTTDKVIEYMKKFRRIPFLSVPKAFFLPMLTIASGGSAGREAPAADVGAGLGSKLGDIFRLTKEDKRKLGLCGISAGFAAVFGTPLAGAVLGVEILFAGSILYSALIPCLIAGIAAYYVASFLGINYFYHEINFVPLNQLMIFEVIAAGIFFGVCALIFIETMESGKKISDKIRLWFPAKALIAGIVLLLLVFVFSSKFLGLGTETIRSSIEGRPAEWHEFFTKGVFTSVTLNFGGSGGIVTPIFFSGSTAGAFFAETFSLDIGTFAALGVIALLAGAANAPLAAGIMGIELFGFAIAPYAIIVCAISFLINRKRSVFPSSLENTKEIKKHVRRK